MKYRRPLPFKILQIFLYLLILFILFYPYSFFLLQTVRQGNLPIQNTFMIQYDYIRQGIPYYREFFRLLQQHSLFWSWNTFLGNPFYTSKSLFLIGDPYAWLGFLLFQKIRYVPTVLFLLTGFKLLLSGLLFSSYIKRLGHSRSAQTFFGIVYMLSGWSMVFLEQIQFLSFYSFIPLFLSGIEEQLNPHRKTWNLRFYFASLLLLLVNYYLLWALCLYAAVYWIIRWHQIHPSAGRRQASLRFHSGRRHIGAPDASIPFRHASKSTSARLLKPLYALVLYQCLRNCDELLHSVCP